MRTNLRRGLQALGGSRHIYPIFGHAHKPSANPDDGNSKHTDPEGVRCNTCHPRSCFGLSSIADRNALKNGAICWLWVKVVQKERSHLFALIDLIKFQRGAPIEYLTADCQSVRLSHTMERTRNSCPVRTQEFEDWYREQTESPFYRAQLSPP